MFEYFKPQLGKLQMKEMEEEKNRIKLCYAFANSAKFYYQELSIINPHANHFDGVHIMPTDLFCYAYERETGKKLKSAEEIEQLVTSLETSIICIGSHDPRFDRTIQLISMPQKTAKNEPADLMILQFLILLSEEEKQTIIKTLKDEYWSL